MNATNNKTSRYVGSLSPEVTNADLVELCKEYKCECTSAHVVMDQISQKSRGYGYLNFADAETADRAHKNLNCRLLKGQAIRIMKVDRNRYKSTPQTERNLFIKTLDPNINERQLYDTLTKYFGPVASVRIIRDRDGASCGRGFVQFENASDADQCFAKLQGLKVGEMEVALERYQPKARNSDEFTNTFVRGLPEATTDESLSAFFSKAGEVTSVKVRMSDSGPDVPAKCLGIGYVAFASFEEARTAVEELSGKKFSINGEEFEETITVERFLNMGERRKRMMERRQKCNLYVRNIPSDWSEEQLREKFSTQGQISSVRIMKRESGESQGFGFVCFTSVEDTEKALKHFQEASNEDGNGLFVARSQTPAERHRRKQNQQTSQMGMGGNMFPTIPGMSPAQIQMLWMQFVTFMTRMGPMGGMMGGPGRPPMQAAPMQPAPMQPQQ